jgi:type I restriction enzyme, S subunit
MSEWKEEILDNLAVVDPEQLSLSTVEDFTFFYIDIGSVSEGHIDYPVSQIEYKGSPSRARKILKINDVLMSTVRPNLKSFAKFNRVSRSNFVASTGFAILRAKKETDIDFIYHSLFSEKIERQIQTLVVGSNYPAINSSDVRKLIFNVPDYPTQRRIARILSTTDAVIEKTQAAIAKYKAIKQGMLHDLFTRGIITEPTSYKDKTGKVVELRRNQLRPKYEDAPELYKESNLGWIPKEWEVDEFQFVCDFITDGSHFSPTPMEDGEIIANVKDMGENGIDYESCTRISKEEFDLLKKQNCSPLFGDVLLSKDGTIGRVVLFNEKREIMLLSSIAILRPSKNINSEYLYCFLKSEYFYKQLLIKTSGSALKRIVLRDINTLLLAFPIDKIEQEMISKRIIQIESKLKSEQNYLHKLQQIKAGLMADLLSGRKGVKIDS